LWNAIKYSCPTKPNQTNQTSQKTKKDNIPRVIAKKTPQSSPKYTYRTYVSKYIHKEARFHENGSFTHLLALARSCLVTPTSVNAAWH